MHQGNEAEAYRPTRGLGYWLSNAGLVREDGVILQREHALPAGGIWFRYIDKDVSLTLPAHRRESGDPVADHWQVDLACGLRGLSERERAALTFSKLQEIAGNIKDALLALPPGAMGSAAPAQDVRFC
jgi:hypothetical protein